MCLVLAVGLVVGSVSPAKAAVGLQDLMARCEASVLGGSAAPLREVGGVERRAADNLLIPVATDAGALVAQFVEAQLGEDQITACQLWGAQSDIAVLFSDIGDFVSWETGKDAASAWFATQMDRAGSVDLSNPDGPGFVVARCGDAAHGTMLSVTPTAEPGDPPNVYFVFSVVTALPARCNAMIGTQTQIGDQ